MGACRIGPSSAALSWTRTPLEDLKAEIIQAKKLAVDEDGAVLAARIDRLPAEEKRLLQTATVIGTMDKNSRNVITDEEHAELEKLVERGARLMLRKAEAAALLRRRGYIHAKGLSVEAWVNCRGMPSRSTCPVTPEKSSPA